MIAQRSWGEGTARRACPRSQPLHQGGIEPPLELDRLTRAGRVEPTATSQPCCCRRQPPRSCPRSRLRCRPAI
jgi:hypothetical protein